MKKLKNVTLHQFPFSHFNEKARWALEFKAVAHKRVNYLPGPHVRAIKKLSGQTKTPVLDIDGRVVAGSGAIIDALEALIPEPALYPGEPAPRAQALDLQRRLDTELGPNLRRALFAEMVDEADYFCRMFTSGRGWAARTFYRAAYPLAKPLIKKGNGITGPESVEQAYKKSREFFDFIAEAVAETGYLVGERFTVADLTAAALLAPAVNPPNSEMAKPEPMPDCVTRFIAHWAEHPTTAWVAGIYREHRETNLN